MSAVTIMRYGGGVYSIVPPGAPTVLGPAAGADVMVLEVAGAHLTWNVLAPEQVPAAVIHDVELAQEWLWAIYGESLAVALADERLGTADAEPARTPLAVGVRRLAYAHWASRWWPASTLDGIAALDPALLDRDIATLTEECDTLVDGADALIPEVPEQVETFPRASDYALAAGDETPTGGLVLARGSGGWDWRQCPPGLVDASERAVSWQLVRDAGTTSVTVSAVAAPGIPAAIPPHLHPWVRVKTDAGVVDTPLTSARDAWVGTTTAPGSPLHINLFVPGFGPRPADTPDTGADARLGGNGNGSPGGGANPAAELRARIRQFAAARLRLAAADPEPTAPDAPLLAEIAAAAEDSDF
ncbi:hypothetical protein [Nocardia huaxiensis]|uniref:hypothetical protein n=1 Tax=Nocardia huaxiensis TaxID=2755382 RepID=UPI001E53D7CF|nr:hypothetical protein [Nocardia huaxiensis]UFS93120.1 hypothetical protein LPY97_19830 [Nocardia huaxiensis]